MHSQNPDQARHRATLFLRLSFVGLYTIANLYSIVDAITSGELGGDFTGLKAPAPLDCLVIGLLLLGAMWFVMFPLHAWFESKTAIRSVAPLDFRPSARLSVLVFLIQAVFLAYAVIYEAGVAGVISKNQSLLKYIFYVISADFLMLFYISTAQLDKFVVLNIVFFITSNVIRGWASVYLYLGWILLSRLALQRQLTAARLATMACLSLVALPLLTLSKYYFRALGSDRLDASQIFGAVDLSSSVYFDAIGISLHELLQRLQHFSSLAVQWNYLATLQAAVESGYAMLFFLEGFLGLAALRAVGIQNSYELNTVLIATVLGTDPSVSGYAAHVGILGWAMVAPQLLPLYLAYLCTLMYLSTKMVAYCQSIGIQQLNWLAWLVLLVHGWFGSFTTYLIAGFLFGYLKRRLSRLAAGRRCDGNGRCTSAPQRAALLVR